MTIMPLGRVCPKCHKRYIWNPDVGKFICPHCGNLGKPPRRSNNKDTKK